MSIKLIVGSILGIGSLGGAVAGGYYLLNAENSKKQQDISDSGSKSSEDSATPKSKGTGQQTDTTPKQTAESTLPAPKAEKGPANAPDGADQPQSTESEVQRATGGGGVQKRE